jgi:uncharacterized protein
MICIYHSRDLDGWMSAAIVRKYADEHGQPIKWIGWDYGQPIPDVSSFTDVVVMVDISFPKEDMKKLNKQGLIWIDHHISAIKDVATLEPLPLIEGLRNDKKAACELTWEFFYPDVKMPDIVHLLGRYDCFGHKGTDEENKVLVFQYAARASLSNVDECYKALIDVKDESIKGWLNTGEGIYGYLKTEAQQIYERRFEVIFDGYRFGCVNQCRFNPINFGIDYNKDGYDGFACFHYQYGKWIYSLYNDNGNVDCSEICKKRGGGGHKGASGFQATTPVL